MHETGIVSDLVRRIERAARDAGGDRIAAVSLRIGALSEFSADHFRTHFDEAVCGTLAEGAALHLKMSDDISDPYAQSVTIEEITVEAPGGCN